MIKSKLLQKSLVVSIAVLFVFWIYNFTGYNVVFLLGCSILFGYYILGDIDSVVLSIFILMPNVMMIKHLVSSFAILGYAILIFEWRYIYLKTKCKCDMSVTSMTILFLLTSGMTFALTFCTSYLLSAIRVISFFIFVNNFFCDNYYKTSSFYDRMILCYCIGVALSVIMGMLFWQLKGMDLFCGYFSGIRNDRNYFSATVSLGIAVSALYYSISKQKDLVKWYPLFMIIMIVGGLLSSSRTFVISLIISLAIIFISMFSIRNVKKLFLLCLLIGLILVISMNNQLIYDHVQTILGRFSADDMRDGNGRFEAWNIYLSDFSSNLANILFGKGTESAIMPRMSVFVATHNTIIQGLYCGGICGLLAYLLNYFDILKRIKGKARLSLIGLFPIFDLFLCRFFIASYMSDTFSFEFLIAIVVAVYGKTGGQVNESCPD